MSIKKFMLGLMVLCMTGLMSGCAVSRMYNTDVIAERGACIVIYVNDVEVYKEGITESQETKGKLDANLVPGLGG